MSDTVYSDNDENFEECLDTVLEGMTPGEESTLYEATKVPYGHGNFGSAERLIEEMQERAYGEAGEYAEDYLLDLDKEDLAGLNKLLADWFSKHAGSPKFWGVKDVTEKQIVVDEDGEYTEVNSL